MVLSIFRDAATISRNRELVAKAQKSSEIVMMREIVFGNGDQTIDEESIRVDTAAFSGSLVTSPNLNGNPNKSASISVPSGALDSSKNLISKITIAEAIDSGLDISGVTNLASIFVDVKFSDFSFNSDGSANIADYAVSGLTSEIEIKISYDDGGDSSLFQTCKYYDETTLALIDTGVRTLSVDTVLRQVTCSTNHCTHFGVQN